MTVLDQRLVSPMTTLNKRLTEIMKKRNMSITELSVCAKVAVGTVQKLMTDPNCNPTVNSLESICTVLDVAVSELVGDEQKIYAALGKPVPILEWNQISDSVSQLNTIITARKNSPEFISASLSLSESAFGLKMKNDSMAPIFPEGCILVFDTEKSAYSNSFVLVKLSNYEGIVFKQLIIDEPHRYIASVNPLLKDNLVKLERQDKIFATLIEAKIQY